MDDDKERLDMDPVSEFTTQSSSCCWSVLPGGHETDDPVDNVYFFGTNCDRDSNCILSEFGWNLPPPTTTMTTTSMSEPSGSYGELDRMIDSNLAGNPIEGSAINVSESVPTFAPSASASASGAVTTTTTSSGGGGGGGDAGVVGTHDVDVEPQPLASSSSSEEQPEKSTASGGSASKQPTETV